MPRPLSPAKKLVRLARLTDQQLLDLIRHGRPSIDPRSGQQAVDANGRPIYTPPSAADLNAARQRIKQLADDPDVKDEMNEYAAYHVINAALKQHGVSWHDFQKLRDGWRLVPPDDDEGLVDNEIADQN